MVIQCARSTNWNSAVCGSKPVHNRIDRAKTISEVDNAMLRALRATTSSSPRVVRMKPAPTNGRKVTSDNSGHWLTAASPLPRSPRHQVPGDEGDDANQ